MSHRHVHGMWLQAYRVIIQHQGLQIHHGLEERLWYGPSQNRVRQRK